MITIVTGLRHHMHRLAASLLLLNPLLGIAQAEKADLILLHGEVLSVDSHDTIAQAIAIRRGVILKTGFTPRFGPSPRTTSPTVSRD